MCLFKTDTFDGSVGYNWAEDLQLEKSSKYASTYELKHFLILILTKNKNVQINF